MIGNIVGINGNTVIINLAINVETQVNLIGLHAVFEDGDKLIVGEITDIDKVNLKIEVLGEIKGNVFLPGYDTKPSFKSKVRIINNRELSIIYGEQNITDNTQFYLGKSTIYNNYLINANINTFLSNHFSILGNTGSGKSFTVSRILQNIFTRTSYAPTKANIILFDAYGEYDSALNKLGEKNPLINYKSYNTNTKDDKETIKIPLWLLKTDDIAHLLGADQPIQIPIIEKSLKLVSVLKSNDPDIMTHKNDIIARALMDILLSGKESVKIRDQIIAVLTNFNTPDLNLETPVVQPGYVRTLRQCLHIDKTGKWQDIDTVVEAIGKFMSENIELKDPDGSIYFNLVDLERAMDFALISEGILKSDKVFDYANILSVRLHNLVKSDESDFFDYPEMITKEEYLRNLFMTSDNKKAQIINFNINYIDDRLAKAITKIISKMVFDFSLEIHSRASIPFHIIIEEAHRYVQNDNDVNVIGYNIFDRISKEGRKYGVILGLITQRPSELSETTISQCSNFLVLRTIHPKDLDYIRNMVPNMSSKILDNLKTLQSGNCIAFGSAFKIPTSIKIDKPVPEPLSNNADLINIWY